MKSNNILLSNSDSGGGIAFNVFKLASEFNLRNKNTKVLILNDGFLKCLQDIIKAGPIIYLYSTSAKCLILSCISYFVRLILGKKTIITQIIYHPRFCDPSVSYFRKLMKMVMKSIPTPNVYYYSDEAARASNINNFNFINKDNIIGLASMYEQTKDVDLPTDLESSIDSHQLHICTIGRLVDFKLGYMLSLISFAKNNPNILLTIVGYGPLQSLILEKIGNYNNIIFMGKKDLAESKSIVKNCDIYVGMGTTLVDAQSLGVTTIVAIESFKEGLTTGFFGDTDSVHYGEYMTGYKYHNLDEFLSNVIAEPNLINSSERKRLIRNPWDKLLDSQCKLEEIKAITVLKIFLKLSMAFTIRPFIKNDYH